MVSKEIIPTSRPFLSFKLGQELFAADINQVQEILEVPAITRVPKAPAYLRGVINLRGQALPVVDTRINFGMPSIPDSVNSCIIVLNIQLDTETIQIGALVDSVQEVLEISPQQIKPTPRMGIQYNTDFLDGMVKLNEQFLMLLNLDMVFSSQELISVKESTSSVVE